MRAAGAGFQRLQVDLLVVSIPPAKLSAARFAGGARVGRWAGVRLKGEKGELRSKRGYVSLAPVLVVLIIRAQGVADAGGRKKESGCCFKEGICVLGSGFGGSHMRDRLSDFVRAPKYCGVGARAVGGARGGCVF